MTLWIKHAAVFVAALTLSACSAVPDKLKVANEDQLVGFEAAFEMPNAANGKPGRWGGVIAEVKNSDDGTIIEVVNFPLNSWGRPVPSDQSTGRFRAKLASFVDPMVYTQGSEITFTGIIGASEKGTIGEYSYLFPVLQVNAQYLWPKRTDKKHVEINYDALWYRHYYYSRPYYPGRIYLPGPVMQEEPQKGDN